MSISLTTYLLIAEMLVINCAPKIGHLLFDPLYFKADKHEEKIGIFRKKIYEALTQPKRESQQENVSDDDFLENLDNSEDHVESTANKDNTNPEIQFSPDNNNDKVKIKTAEGEPPSLLNKQTSNGDAKNIIIYPTKDPEDNSKQSNDFSLPIRILRNKEVVGSVIKSGYDYDMQICTLINGVIMCGYNKNIGPIESDKQITEIENGCRIRGDRLECGYDRLSKGSGDSPANPRQMLKGNSNIIHVLNSQLQETEEQDSTKATLRQYVKSLSSLLCTDCRATTHKRDITSEVVTTHATETTSATLTFMPSSTLMSTTTKERPTTHEDKTILSTLSSETTKEEPTTHADEKTKLLSTTETNTSAIERITTPKVESEAVKTSKQNLRKNNRKNDEKSTTDEKIVDVTRCVEKGDRIVCYKIRNATKPSKK